jgi:hypothetical protein
MRSLLDRGHRYRVTLAFSSACFFVQFFVLEDYAVFLGTPELG